MIASARLLHVTTGTDIGGAEMVLFQLLKSVDTTGMHVLSMMEPGPIAQRIGALGVEMRTLGMHAGERPSVSIMAKLRRMAQDLEPEITQGWMYHGSLAALFATRCQRRRGPLIWSIHHGLNGLDNEKPTTRAVIRLLAQLSGQPSAVVYCATASARDHERIGFVADKTVVIPNGVDCSLFSPDPSAGARLRQHNGIPAERKIIGFVGRVHPMKDHRNLIQAVRILIERGGDVHLVLVGSGDDQTDKMVSRMIDENGIGDRATSMGQRHDVPAIVSGFDVFCLPSAWGEAFPMVICEAMASAVPCVVTDVGDAALIVGETGRVVPTQDSKALADALEQIIGDGRGSLSARGQAARHRIATEFPLAKMVAAYQDLNDRLIEDWWRRTQLVG